MQDQAQYFHDWIQTELELVLHLLLHVQFLHPLINLVLRGPFHGIYCFQEITRERGQLYDIGLADLSSYFFYGMVLALNQQFCRPIFVNNPSNFMYVINLVALVLLQVEMISFDIDTCHTTSTTFYKDSEHHSFSEFFWLHREVNAWSDDLCYLSFEDPIGLLVLIIFNFVEHQDWDSSLEKFSFGKFYLF